MLSGVKTSPARTRGDPSSYYEESFGGVFTAGVEFKNAGKDVLGNDAFIHSFIHSFYFHINAKKKKQRYIL